MATTLELLIKAKNATDAAFADVQKNLKNTGKQAKQGSAAMKVFGLASLAAIGALGASIYTAAADFEKGMSNVNTLLGQNKKQFDVLRKGVLDFGKDSVKPMEELTEAMYDVVSAGIAQDKQLQTLRDSEKLAVAGLGTTKEAVDLVTSSMNAFGVDSAKASNIVFEAVQAGKTTVSELAQGFGQVAGAAKQMGVSYEEFLAIAAAGTTTGQKASVVWTSQKAILNALIKPTKEMADLFKRLHVKDGAQLIETSGGLVNALKKLEGATKGNSDEFARALSSSEALNLSLQILGASGDAYQNTLANMLDGVNSVDSAYEKQKNTVDALSNQIKNNLNVAMIEIGSIALPIVAEALKEVVKGLKSATSWFQSLDPDTQKSIVSFGAFALGALAAAAAVAALGFALGVIISPLGLLTIAIAAAVAAWQTDFGGFRSRIEIDLLKVRQQFDAFKLTLQVVGQAAKVAFDALALAVLQGVHGALEGLAAIPSPLQQTFKDAAKGIEGTMNNMATALVADSAALNQSMAEYANLTKTQVQEQLTLLYDQAARMSGDAKTKQLADADALAQQMVQKYGEMQIGTTEQVALMKEYGSKNMEELKMKLEDQLGKMKDIADASSGETKKIMTDAWSMTKDHVVSIVGELNTGTSQELAATRESATAESQKIGTAVIGQLSLAATMGTASMKSLNTGVTKEAASTANNVKQEFTAVSGSAFGWGANLGAMFTAGLMSKIGALKAAAASAMEGVKAVMGFHSPTEEGPGSDADTWAPNLIEMFAQGIRDTAPKVYGETDKMVQAIRERFGSDGQIMEILKNFDKDKVMGQKFQEIYTQILAKSGKIQDQFDGLKIDYQKLNQDAGESLADLNKKHADSIASITEKLTSLQAKITDVNESYNQDVQGIDTSIGERVVDQQQLISDLQKQVAEQQAAMVESVKGEEGATVSAEDSAKLQMLQDQLAKEQQALQDFSVTAIGYQDEINEARRRANLTDFERFLEDQKKKKDQLSTDYEEKKLQLQKELEDLQAQRIAEAQIYEQKIAQYTATKEAFKQMEDVFATGLDSMALNAETKINFIKNKFEELKKSFGDIGTSPLAATFTNAALPAYPTASGALGTPLIQASAGPSTATTQAAPTEVNFNFGDINIAKEVDGDALIEKMKKELTRTVQLQKLGSQ